MDGTAPQTSSSEFDARSDTAGTTRRRALRIANAALEIPAGIARWLKRRHTRRMLAALDDRQLRDIGISRSEIWKL